MAEVEKTKETTQKKPVEEKKGKISKAAASLATAVPAEVLELVGRIGGKNTTMQVRVKILEGRDSGKISRRNVLGPVRLGDILLLTQTEMEATPLRGSRR